jgi:transcriptional regulator with XRE-family HTH domain
MKRETNEIKAWLVRREITQTEIAREAGVTPGLVNRTIYGKANNRRVLRRLVEKGVPEKLLGLPEDMQRKEAR